ncbi:MULTISPECIES: RNA 2',3'-cyclic phosphodiesterase [unclassified Sinorhizobium]|uniref:RNA 2',3'-cyclic phosphodiesterase n=1 Tax=unclassified Sinorhizobium TaxID=2613772 RepID=UPI003523BEF7
MPIKRPEQLSLDLPSLSSPGRRRVAKISSENLFFGIVPEPDIAARAIDLMQRFGAAAFRLQGKFYQPERLHVTLNFLGAYPILREDIVFAAMQAGASIAIAPFSVTFDRLASFETGPNGALVLRCAAGTRQLTILHRAIDEALAYFAVHPGRRASFVPHLTLFRGRNSIDETRLDEPLTWTVREFKLIHSLYGRSQHKHIERWPLLEQ